MNTLRKLYFDKGAQLEALYTDTSWKNHCFWRIALDNIVHERWNLVVPRPAYQHLSQHQLEEVVALLERYKHDRNLLEQHNSRSMTLRRMAKKRQL